MSLSDDLRLPGPVIRQVIGGCFRDERGPDAPLSSPGQKPAANDWCGAIS